MATTTLPLTAPLPAPQAPSRDARSLPSRGENVEALDKAAVAELSAAVIEDMTAEELVRLVRSAELLALLRSDADRRLPSYDRSVLLRLAHLARQCCRNRAGAPAGTDDV